MLTEKGRVATDEDTSVFTECTNQFPRGKTFTEWALMGARRSIAIRKRPCGSISGLLQKHAPLISFTRASCYSWSSKIKRCFDKKISAPHFVQPPAINKEPESNTKMYVNQIM